MKRLLVISYRFPPETYPLVVKVRRILDHLRGDWEIDAITSADDPWTSEGLRAHHVEPWRPKMLLKGLRRLRLSDFIVWPDPYIFWVVPAFLKARSLIQKRQYSAIVVFMMPYSQGAAGILLKKWSDLPLVLNFDDSPTCSDMNATFPTPLHYRLARRMEDWYVQQADAAIYVSRRNMERVRARQPTEHQKKFHLIRFGAEPVPRYPEDHRTERDAFRIVYTGGMGGWYWFINFGTSKPSLLRQLYRKWRRWARHRVAKMDGRSHSPVYIGQSIKRVCSKCPELQGRIQLDLIGNQVDRSIVDQVLHKFDLQGIVNVYEPVPHTEVKRQIASADLLFMALPDRPDGSPGGRISAKTYEYLMTDRPILAALPPGENREYLEGRPGVYLVGPKDVDGMARVIERLAQDFLSGQPHRVERPETWSEIDGAAREAFENVIHRVIK